MPLVDEKTLQEAALQLLASSTSRRYAREAVRIAEESGLVEAAKVDFDGAWSQLDRLRELLPSVTQDEETPAEFEAALLLCALARCGHDEITTELRRIVEHSRLHSPWLRALAMRIPQFGPPTNREFEELRQRLEQLLQGSVEPPKSLEIHDSDDPRLFPRAA